MPSLSNLMSNPLFVWLIILVILLVAEGVTMGLTTIWFAGGALAALAVAGAGTKVPFQVVIFLIVSIVLLILLRPIAKKKFNVRRVATNADQLIGETAVVIEPIDNVKAAGRVKVRGQEWAARAAKGFATFAEGDLVKVTEIQGVKLIVEKAEFEEQSTQE